MSNVTTVLSALPTEHRDRLMRIAREVSFPVGTRIFEQGGRADRFWLFPPCGSGGARG
ncbi:hypothetical protein KY5_7222 [Streptomyces formicae]|uniref:Cyclic nucleotide-binding domain-containing protein n=1 Tax=Streptomyces formicae TaxID=1616117 RepID=A0A291QK88_9ACTN|nr:hypothetical protein [Streptomyces formicae]ATL32240.1 hypothetical protein KY5_7222 [Streptomyces formicae]